MRGWLERHGVRAILSEQRILIHCQPLMLRISMLGNHMVQRVIMIGKRAYENETSKATAGVRRRAGSVSQVRRSHAADSFRSALHACAPRTCVQKEVLGEPPPPRTQAKGQAFGLGPRFPRHGLIDGFRFSHLASE